MSSHTDLAQTLAEGISSGRFPVGSLLPTEFELCEQHRASRYTVRKALEALQEMGLISRRKNVGTRVEASRPAAGFTQSVATVDQLAQYGAEHVRTLRSIEELVADLDLAQEIGCAGGTRWLRISSLRMEDGEKAKPMKPTSRVTSRPALRPALRPIGWTDVYVDAAYREVGELVRETPHLLISTLIETHFGRRIARIRQDIQATSLSKTMAAELRAEPGSPALKIVRHYLDAAGEAFEISVSIHPADRFTFSTELLRGKDPAGAA